MRNSVVFILTVVSILSGCANYPQKIFWENKVKPTAFEASEFKVNTDRWNDADITYAWLGHATVLINFNGIWILTDPVLHERIGPPEIFSNLFGIKRLVELPISPSQLPEIELVVVSHPHFDHLDLASLNTLREKYDYSLIVPAFNRSLLDTDFINVQELDWMGRADKFSHYKNLTVTAFRVEHYGYADWGDRNVKRGFNGYLLSDGDKHIAFFGDTSYSRFRDANGKILAKPRTINWPEKFSPDLIKSGIDLCIIPIGDSTYYWNHIGPENAVRLAQELNCKKVLPIHYATFLLTPPDDEVFQPKSQLLKTLYKQDNLNLVKCQSMQEGYTFPDIGVSCRMP